MIGKDLNKPTLQRIAALITCHNRKDDTLACLRSLFDQDCSNCVEVVAFVVDAGSSDGTGFEIRRRFPQVRLIHRDESLFWCGGMRTAFEAAEQERYDYYLWVNDDTVLMRHGLRVLLAAAGVVQRETGGEQILVGSTYDPETGVRTYGGMVRASRLRPLGFRPVEPGPQPKPCDTFNGNVVLVPRLVARAVGNLCGQFTHAIADTDYGLRARKMGISSWVAPGYVGLCRRNSDAHRWCDPALPVRARLRILRSPKGLPPRQWRIFARRHAPVQWPMYWLSLYLRACFPRFWSLLRSARRWK